MPTCAHLQTPRKLCLLRRGCRKSCGAVIVSCALRGFPWLCPGSLGSAAALWYGWFPARGCTPWIYSRHGAAPTAPVLWHPPPWPGSSLSSMVGVLLAAWGTVLVQLPWPLLLLLGPPNPETPELLPWHSALVYSRERAGPCPPWLNTDT